ncbi:MAG TPA: hypothetical protein VNR70_12820 [Steroidobacteraceae bacterium]|nr:hypothetical protein [Steroidobacteraceae bacterium]
MIITLIVILTIALAPRLTLWQLRNSSTDRGFQTLIDAKAAILAHAANPGVNPSPSVDPYPGRRLGQISLTPDLPISAGSTYDGLSKQDPLGNPGCATRTWVPGQPLIDPNTYGTPLNVRCFGRLPWLSYGLPGPSTPDDQEGEIPWMFVSANLVVSANCLGLANLNPLMLSSNYTTGGCGTPVPFPWLNVVDNRGNVLSSEVAIVLILPGPPVNNAQQRVAPNDRSPAAYLEGLTIAGACPAPCVLGTYNNATYTVANGSAWTFVNAPPSTGLGPPPSYYRQPFAFNDRLIYITASEYFEAMEQRARLVALQTLSQFRAANGYLPYSGDNPSNPSAPLGTTCTSPQSRFGLLPASTATNCGGTLTFPTWYTAAGWGSYFIYAVDSGCVAGAPVLGRCLNPTLRLGSAATRYNAVLFSSGRAIQNAPYAASKGTAQAPAPPPVGSGSLRDFLDSTTNIAGPPFDAAGTPTTANYNDRMYGIL